MALTKFFFYQFNIIRILYFGFYALMPEISRISAKMTRNGKDRIAQIYRRVMKLIFLFGIPMYGALIITSPLLLRVWLGERFVETLPGAFRIILLGTFMSLLGVHAYYTLMGVGHVRHNLLSQIVQSAANMTIVCCLLIVSALSVTTIAWSSSIAMAASTLYLTLQKQRLL